MLWSSGEYLQLLFWSRFQLLLQKFWCLPPWGLYQILLYIFEHYFFLLYLDLCLVRVLYYQICNYSLGWNCLVWWCKFSHLSWSWQYLVDHLKFECSFANYKFTCTSFLLFPAHFLICLELSLMKACVIAVWLSRNPDGRLGWCLLCLLICSQRDLAFFSS